VVGEEGSGEVNRDGGVREMKILHVITGMRKAAGTSVFVAELSNELVAKGHEVAIAVCNPEAKDVCPFDVRVKLIGIEEIEGRKFDVVHIHALWSPVLHRVSKWAHKNKIPVVWSPHGMLQKWALKNKWWKKALGLALYQWNDLKKANLLHATAESEVEDIRRIGLKNKIVVAPLGVRVMRQGEPGMAITHSTQNRTLLFVSRVQRKKGLPVLIDAWAKLPEDVKKGWKVRIVGPDQDNHTAELKAQCERLGVSENFTFTGPKYGDELDAEYRGADIFVLPTHSENFGSVVIEALARSVPVICSQGAPWKELEEYGCGWWPKDSVEALEEALKKSQALSPDALQKMGEKGRRLVEEKYTWQAVGESMIKAYKGIRQ